jgi:hypothetical protein
VRERLNGRCLDGCKGIKEMRKLDSSTFGCKPEPFSISVKRPSNLNIDLKAFKVGVRNEASLQSTCIILIYNVEHFSGAINSNDFHCLPGNKATYSDSGFQFLSIQGFPCSRIMNYERKNRRKV